MKLRRVMLHCFKLLCSWRLILKGLFILFLFFFFFAASLVIFLMRTSSYMRSEITLMLLESFQKMYYSNLITILAT